MKRAPSHLRGAAARQQGKLIHLPRRGDQDALCRHCDDSGVLPIVACEWKVCTCKAGARVLEQLATREARA